MIDEFCDSIGMPKKHDIGLLEALMSSPKCQKMLSECLYTASEKGLFECESMSEEDAIKAFCIVWQSYLSYLVEDETFEKVIKNIKM